MSTQFVLAAIGSVAGLAYAVLGIAALKHLQTPTTVDRAVGWSLWWFTEAGRYSKRGQALCRLGAVAFLIASASWLGWFILQRG